MRSSRFTLSIVIAALIAMGGSAVWIGSDNEIEVAPSGKPAGPSDPEALLGVGAAESGELRPPRSLHATSRRGPRPREVREPRPREVREPRPREVREPGPLRRDTREPGPLPREDPAREAGATISAPAHPLIRVREGGRVPIRTKPEGDVVEVVGSSTEFGSPTVFGIVRTAGHWAAVSTPAVPNHKLGWIRLDRRLVDFGWTERSIHVSLSERRATLRERGKNLHAFRVTIGAPGTETPAGRFAVTDVFRGGLNPVYGCCAVALSASQPDLPPGWPGGDRIAIHGNGTGGPLGEAASNGCLRADDRDVNSLIGEVDLGTPVFIFQ